MEETKIHFAEHWPELEPFKILLENDSSQDVGHDASSTTEHTYLVPCVWSLDIVGPPMSSADKLHGSVRMTQ